MDLDQTPQLRRQGRGGQPREGLVHDGYGADLFLGEFVGPLEVVDLDLPLLRRVVDLLGFHVSGGYGAEKLIYFIL